MIGAAIGTAIGAAPLINQTGTVSRPFDAAGVATGAFVGASRNIAAISEAGIATVSFEGSSVERAAFSAAAVATVAFVGNDANAILSIWSVNASAAATFGTGSASVTAIASDGVSTATFDASSRNVATLSVEAGVEFIRFMDGIPVITTTTFTAAGVATPNLRGSARRGAYYRIGSLVNKLEYNAYLASDRRINPERYTDE